MEPILTNHSNSHKLRPTYTLDTHLEFKLRLPNMHHYRSTYCASSIAAVVQISITRLDSKAEHRFPQSLTLYSRVTLFQLTPSNPSSVAIRRTLHPKNAPSAQNAEGRMTTPCYTRFYTCIHPIPPQHITSNSHNLGRRSMSHLRKCQYPALTRLFGGGGSSRQPQITGYEEALVATIEPQSLHTIDDLPP